MNINFKKKFGQNFISDKNLLDAIIVGSGISSTDTVVEVGAGAGALTRKLCQSAKKVVAYEIDKDLEPVLAEALADYNNYTLIFKDFLSEETSDIKAVAGTGFKVVANLPYYITSPLISKFLTCGLDVKSLTVMVQKEVADRIVAKPKTKDYGVLSIMVQLCGTAKILRKVPRQMFTPAPNVDSAVVKIDVQDLPEDYNRLVEFVKLCFFARRKTLYNNVVRDFDMQDAYRAIENLGKPQTVRPEELSPAEFKKLFDSLKAKWKFC
jgi:16S rRNA (adenine1518-N6/adenine1519-N6)-dimethyltransferase